MSEQTMTGPARLRQIANRMDLVDYEMAQDLRQMAALWEADLERASCDHDLAMSIMADRLTRAERAEAALEQARALLAEQAEIITANVWHIPPEYSARNIVLDAAVKMRDFAALLAAAPGGAA